MARFTKGQSGNPQGSSRKVRERKQDDADDGATLLELLLIAKDKGKAPTARVSAIREWMNRSEGLPRKSEPQEDPISESTAQRLIAIASLLEPELMAKLHER